MIGTTRVGIVGGSGWLGGAIAQALLDKRIVEPKHLSISYRSAKGDQLPGAFWTSDNGELAARSDVVIISVRPQDFAAVSFEASGKLCISVMAGIGLGQLQHCLPDARIVRALPNAAAEVGKSYTPWIASTEATEADKQLVKAIFDSCGTSDEVRTERELEYLTGLSGSGPAFPALLASAMISDAIQHGIAPAIAHRALMSILVGTGRLFEKNNQCPSAVVDTFLDYRGTTAAAIEAMRAAGFESAVSKGLEAALRKSSELGTAN